MKREYITPELNKIVLGVMDVITYSNPITGEEITDDPEAGWL